MDNKAKLSKCLGYLAVALAQYVREYGLLYSYRVDQIGGEAISFRMFDYEHVRTVGRHFSVDYILSLEEPIDFLRTELIDIHEELFWG